MSLIPAVVSRPNRRPTPGEPLRLFPARWTVEENPHGEILREVLEPVEKPRRDEKEVPGSERNTLMAVDELASSPGDHVRFVARMAVLRIAAQRRIDLHDETAVGEEMDRALHLAVRDRRKGLVERNVSAE